MTDCKLDRTRQIHHLHRQMSVHHTHQHSVLDTGLFVNDTLLSDIVLVHHLLQTVPFAVAWVWQQIVAVGLELVGNPELLGW